jgi:hypothetical protein
VLSYGECGADTRHLVSGITGTDDRTDDRTDDWADDRRSRRGESSA